MVLFKNDNLQREIIHLPFNLTIHIPSYLIDHPTAEVGTETGEIVLQSLDAGVLTLEQMALGGVFASMDRGRN